MSIFKRKKLIISSIFLALVCVLSYVMFQANSSSFEMSNPSLMKSYWVKEIKEEGAEKTYAKFKVYAETLTPETQHLAAHIMGGALFEALGLEGIIACDTSIQFGCFHGFFARAVATGGEAMIEELDEKCVEEFGQFGTGCQHGIGHGILEYTGRARLNDALALCNRTTSQLVPLLGCTSGVFMEYNTPAGGAGMGGEPSVRAFDASNPHEPCPSVPEEYRAACYYELGGWLLFAVDSDYERIGFVCGDLSAADQLHCFLGIGASVAILQRYSVPESLAVCARLSGENELYCRAGVSWIFFGDPVYREQHLSACAYESKVKTSECLALADFTKRNDRTDYRQ